MLAAFAPSTNHPEVEGMQARAQETRARVPALPRVTRARGFSFLCLSAPAETSKVPHTVLIRSYQTAFALCLSPAPSQSVATYTPEAAPHTFLGPPPPSPEFKHATQEKP